MRWLGAAGLLLAALLATALWQAPRWLDEAALRPRLAAIASERLARPVTLAGPIVLQLLPEPRLEASDVAIGDAATDRIAATARGLRVTLDVRSLLLGRLETRELVIVGAELRLPWPPAALQDLRPPPWLAAFEARLEDSRVRLAHGQIDGLEMRLASQGGNAALEAEGRFTWRGRPVRFSGRLGRAGVDGAAPLEIGLNAAAGQLSLSGILDAAGSFEGDLATAGPDLSLLFAAPPGPFEARGRLVAGAELVAIDPLDLRLDRQALRGAASLRLAPELKLDVALNAGGMDVDGWMTALRQGAKPPLPVNIDLAAETARLGGLPVRRLRGAFAYAADRLTILDASVLLPGEVPVELSGASAGARIELGVRVGGGDLRQLLVAVGLPPPPDPARLRRAEGRLRLALENGEATVTDLDARIDGVRVTGGGAWRTQPRPTLGLGLTVGHLALDGLLPERWPAAATLGGLDLNLRLAADAVAWRGVAVGRAALDAGLESGRLTVRRLGFRLGTLDITGSAVAELNDAPRVTELTVEAGGRGAQALAGLLPGNLQPFLAVDDQPATLRLGGAGSAEALALRLEAEFGALRVEATGSLDTVAGRAAGTATLRHPGAPRVLAPLLGPDAAGWLGEGSLAVIGALTVSPEGIVAEHLDVVAGELRGQGRLALALDGPRPRLTGRVNADHLPLPPLPGRDIPWRMAALDQIDVDLQVEAERVTPAGLPPLERAIATVRVAGGGLAVSGLRTRLAGGSLAADFALVRPAMAASSRPTDEAAPTLTLRASLADATLTAPLSGWPIDFAAGRFGGDLDVSAQGRSAGALLATLGGTARIAVRDGVVIGFDLPAAQAATRQDPAKARQDLTAAFAAGASGFEQLGFDARLQAGRALVGGEIRLADDVAVGLDGVVDLSRGGVDLLVTLTPTEAAPPIGLRLAGPWTAPRRLPELAPYLRWRAERG